MKKFLFLILIFSLFPIFSSASNSIVTATIQDPTGQVYAGGNVSAVFVPNSTQPNLSLYTVNGANFNMGPITGTLNGAGTFTITLTDNQTITPAGSKWMFTICPLASVQCPQILLSVTGAATNLSAQLNAQIPTIQVIGNPYVTLAYADSEVQGRKGLFYWNTTSNSLRCHNGIAWAACSGSGGGSSVGSINVLTDCTGVVGDNITDDGPAIQTCLNNHPGREIIFPTTSVSVSGGGPLTNASYYSSVTLTMSGNNQRLVGPSGGLWSGGTAIRFGPATGGIIIPSTCYACKVEHLELQSPDIGVTGSKGIYVQGGHVSLSNLVVNGFDTAIEIDGAASNANSWQASLILMNYCHSRCWYAHGPDANAGYAFGLNANSAGSTAIEDGAAYHNVYVSCQTGTGPTTPYKDSTGGGAVWIGNYQEGAQPASIIGMVFGGNMVVDTTTGYPMLWNIGNGAGAGTQSQTYLELWNQKDQLGSLDIRSGKTADTTSDIRFLTFAGATKFRIRYLTGSPPSFQLYDEVYGSWFLSTISGNNQNIDLRAKGNGSLNLNFSDGTGCIKLGNGASSVIYNFCPTLATISEPMLLASYIDVTEIAAPANPAAGVERWYAASGTHLQTCVRSDGTDCNPATAAYYILSAGCRGTASAGATVTMPTPFSGNNLNCTGTLSSVGAVVRAGTVQFLYAKSINGGVNASSGVVTVYKNNVATTMTCTFGTGTSCNDTAHSFAVAAGDDIDVRFTTQGGETLGGVTTTVYLQ